MPRLLPYRISKIFSRLWAALRKFVGIDSLFPITVHVYRGFGNKEYLFLRGRVLRDKTIIRRKNDTNWHNFINTAKRFISWEIEGAELEINFKGCTFFLKTDTEGYFTLDEQLATPLSNLPDEEPFWRKATIKVHSIPKRKVSFECQADIIFPDQDSEFGIISDIDDTILKTYVTSWMKWRMLYLTIIHNAITRQTIESVTTFLQALRRGSKEKAYNPFFYISNSPWNLYDLLEEFLKINKLPRGPILLRDFGLPYEEVPKTYKNHKHHHIVSILNLYPHLSFVLIGDSGEKDADIYQSICAEYPNRIKAVYIRDVGSRKRAERVREILNCIPNTPCLLISHYDKAIEHAQEIGLIANSKTAE